MVENNAVFRQKSKGQSTELNHLLINHQESESSRVRAQSLKAESTEHYRYRTVAKKRSGLNPLLCFKLKFQSL
ncbi:MAG: hypothetical protein FWG92_07020 [Leptospirales bacterium]|nr:hypothetical protein [Leptospirales bacterium]